jgi:hypothetical protein
MKPTQFLVTMLIPMSIRLVYVDPKGNVHLLQPI